MCLEKLIDKKMKNVKTVEIFSDGSIQINLKSLQTKTLKIYSKDYKNLNKKINKSSSSQKSKHSK